MERRIKHYLVMAMATALLVVSGAVMAFLAGMILLVKALLR